MPSGNWHAACSSEEFKLSICYVGTGFDLKVFEMLRNLDPYLRPVKVIQELI